MTQNIHELLLLHPLFNELASNEASWIDAIRLRNFSKGDVIYRPGLIATHAYLIIDGSIKFEMAASSGRQVFVEVVGKDFLIGELELLSGIDYQSTAVANEDARLILIPKDILLLLIASEPGFAMKFIKQLATNFYFYQIITAERQSSNLKSQLANLLVSLGKRFGKLEGEKAMIEISHDQLSDMLNASRQRINMQLNEWQRDGLILCKYGKIVINDIGDFSSHSGLVGRIITEDNIAPYQ